MFHAKSTHYMSPQIELLLIILICARVYMCVHVNTFTHIYVPLNINELHGKINECPICRRQSMRHALFVAM